MYCNESGLWSINDYQVTFRFSTPTLLMYFGEFLSWLNNAQIDPFENCGIFLWQF